ncbi:MAG: metalloprotease TldD, partial [Acidobacteria bacterium]|nr:metalloprotease TldD [Acidobacteriota bacterium]
MIDPVAFFTTRFPIGLNTIEEILGVALSRGGDYADLYFEYSVLNSISLEEQIIKSAARTISQGVGVRVISGERTGYAYVDSIERSALCRAAETAAQIASQPRAVGPVKIGFVPPGQDLYPVERVVGEQPLEERISLLHHADRETRSQDRRVREVQAGLTDEHKVILVASSTGRLTGDVQPLA